MENGRKGLKDDFKKSLKRSLGKLYYHGIHRHVAPTGNRVLIYHALGTRLPDDTYGTSISPAKFKEHLAFLVDHFPLISLDEITSRQAQGKHSVSLTFDDGYKDNLIAAETCEKWGIPYTIYMIADRINQPLYLSKSDLSDLAKSKLCTIGSHGLTHGLLGRMPREQAWAEIRDSKALIQDITGQPVYHLSYPHGSYHSGLFSLLQKAGYRSAACSGAGINPGRHSSRYRLCRSEVIASDKIVDLKEKILGYYDYLAFRRKMQMAPATWAPDPV